MLSGGLALSAVWLLPTTSLATVNEADDHNEESPVAQDSTISTVQPQVRDLVTRYEASGSVSAAVSQAVASPAEGTLVWMTEPGTLIQPGDVLAVVDDHPVTVIEGGMPMWRALTVGDEGADVKQLELALAGFGFNADANVTIDEIYTSATSAMVSEWQAEIGAVETGTVGRYDVVALDQPMTVSGTEVIVGALLSEGDVLLGLDSTEQIVRASIPVAEAVTLSVGDAADLDLPDRSTLSGVVRTISLGSDTAVRIAEIEIINDSGELSEELPGVRSLQGVTVEVGWDDIIATDVLTLPADTFRHLDDGSYVLGVLSGDGSVTALVVEPGRQVGNFVEVASLPLGAQVVQP